MSAKKTEEELRETKRRLWTKYNADPIKKAYKSLWAKKNRNYLNEYRREWVKNHPWWNNYRSAEQRCNNPKADKKGNYFKKGIKFLMTMEDFKNLWFRDKAYEMVKPTIDRKDSSKDYTFENCQYIEHVVNSSKREYRLGRQGG